MRFLARWFVTFLAVLVVSYLGKDRFISFEGQDWIRTAAIFSLVLGLLNAFVRPVLRILTLPLTIITLGLFTLVLNLLMFWLASYLVPGIQFPGRLLGLIVASVLVSIVGSVISRILDVR
jgi:putative membrane protein